MSSENMSTKSLGRYVGSLKSPRDAVRDRRAFLARSEAKMPELSPLGRRGGTTRSRLQPWCETCATCVPTPPKSRYSPALSSRMREPGGAVLVDQPSSGRWQRTTVPSPGADSMSSCPPCAVTRSSMFSRPK